MTNIETLLIHVTYNSLHSVQVENDKLAWCKTNFVNSRALKRSKDIHKQLQDHLKKSES